MYNNNLSVDREGNLQRVGEALSSAGQYIKTWAKNRASAFHAGVQQMQLARMTCVLRDMTDQQLAQIDLAREDIAAHAAKMVGIDPKA